MVAQNFWGEQLAAHKANERRMSVQTRRVFAWLKNMWRKFYGSRSTCNMLSWMSPLLATMGGW